MCGVSYDRSTGFDFVSLAVWWLHGWFVGGVVYAIVVVVRLVLAMPGLYCFLGVTLVFNQHEQDSHAYTGGLQVTNGILSYTQNHS